MDIINLKAGQSALGLSPRYGGAVLGFSHNGQDMFKPVESGWDADRNPMKTSCFPLVPYSNRIADAVFDFEGRAVNLRPAYIDQDHALHGMGWVRPWTVTRQTKTECECVYTHSADQWPWDFIAKQSFVLKQRCLELTLSITNDSASIMPAGLGPHPYFPNKKTATLQFQTDGVWRADSELLPKRWSAPPKEWDFSDGVQLSEIKVDNCFTGLGDTARINWSDAQYGLEIQSDKAQQWGIVYVPDAAPYFCFEPVTHMNNAHNWAYELAGTGLRSLPPGDTFSVTTVFQVTG